MSRRKLVAACVASATLVVSLTTAAATGQAKVAADPPDLADFTLVSTGGDLPDRVERLDDELPKLGVQKLLEQANRVATPGCTPDMPEDPRRSWCFNDGDNHTTNWRPQGVTTVADAQQDLHWGDKQALLVSWYDSSKKDDVDDGEDKLNKGARISFLDPATNKYRHVLLVYPYDGANGPTYETITTPQQGEGGNVHAGGIVWYGNYLYVADTRRGIRVFDMRRIMDLKAAGNGDTSDKSKVGLHGGKYYGHGYRFVMPQVANWQHPDGLAEHPPEGKCNADGPAKFSYLSLDRSGTDKLISGEYCKGASDANHYGRVVQWPMNGDNGKPKTGGDGEWQAESAYRLPKQYVQGATSFDGRWYLSSTGGGANAHGHLQAAKPGTTGTGVLHEDGPERDVATGVVEDLSFWHGRDELWTVTEAAGNRKLYALPRDPA